MSRRGSRRSLMPSTGQRLSGRFAGGPLRSESGVSTTDQSDGEWDRLQARVAAASLMGAQAEASARAALEDESLDLGDFPFIDDAPSVISMKEAEAEELTEQAVDIQSRFVWDLSFAIKQMLIQENAGKAEAISRIGVRDIVKRLESDPPHPRDWVPWIREAFEAPLAA